MARHSARDPQDEEPFALFEDEAEGDEAVPEGDFAILFTPDPDLRRAIAKRRLH